MNKTGEKLHPLIHCRKRPQAYIGDVDTHLANIYVFDEDAKKIQKKEITWNQGLFNIIREIGSNCIDNMWRSIENDIVMSKIKIDINSEEKSITFWNNGYCIPVFLESYKIVDPRKGDHIEEMYPAEMFFSEMLSGTNFEKVKGQKSSGMYGMGAKATNALSDFFEVEHSNPEQKKKFKQQYTKGAQKRSEPEIEKYTKKTGYTQIKFIPSYGIFKFPSEDTHELTEDFICAIKAYAYEISLVTSLPVFFNGVKILVSSLQQYAKLYTDVQGNRTIYLKEENNKYNVSECVLLELTDPNKKTDIEHVTFVNGVNPKNGGTHVDAWKGAIFTPLVKLLNQKFSKQDLKVTTKDLVPYFILFIKCEVDEWKWDGSGQSKDKYIQPFKVSHISEIDCLKISKWGFVDDLREKLTAVKELKDTKKGAKKKKIVYGSKAIEANKAGTKLANKCTLLIVEGQSAKALAVDLIPHLPGKNDLNGVFAIKGKFVNAEDKNKTLNNEEVQMLQAMLGLIPKVDYTQDDNRKKIRYGNVNFLTDQDEDGFHIRGLLINFFYRQYKEVWEKRIINFHTENTPIILAYYSKNIKPFFSNLDYQTWLDDQIKHIINYYKGLGAWSRRDAKYLADNRKIAKFTINGNSEEDDYMEIAFGKDESNKRKEWIMQRCFQQDTECNGEEIFIDKIEGDVSIAEFMNSQLIQFWKIALKRAIPSLIDGFKKSQRKIYYTFVKENITKLITVEAASGLVSKTAGYHHGANSLCDSIANMGRDFVGSNNIPVIKVDGQAGSRLCGGQDAAQPRYLRTCLQSFSKTIFHPDDNEILEYMKDDGKVVEPQYYLPIIPMILVNGATGVAVGWATCVPPYNPLDICKWIKNWLQDKPNKPLIPWWRGFTGEVEVKGNKVFTKGVVEKTAENTYRVTELPIKYWTDDFKEYLEEWSIERKSKDGKKFPPIISKIFLHNKNTNTVDITFTTKDYPVDIEDTKNIFHKLVKNAAYLNNMVVLNESGYPETYSSPEDLIQKFCEVRLPFYQKRKDHLLAKNRRDLKILKNKLKFVKAITVDKTLDLANPDTENEEQMIALNIEKIDDSFDYLFNMHIRSITLEKIELLRKEISALISYIKDLRDKDIKDMWITDINEFILEYKKFLVETNED